MSEITARESIYIYISVLVISNMHVPTFSNMRVQQYMYMNIRLYFVYIISKQSVHIPLLMDLHGLGMIPPSSPIAHFDRSTWQHPIPSIFRVQLQCHSLGQTKSNKLNGWKDGTTSSTTTTNSCHHEPAIFSWNKFDCKEDVPWIKQKLNQEMMQAYANRID